MPLTRARCRAATNANAVHDGILRIIQEFRRAVFRSSRRNGDPDQLPPADVVEDLTGYVRGRAAFDTLLRIFACSVPRYHGLYFPAPRGDELTRWEVAATQAIESLVALKTRSNDAGARSVS